jgi:hypothetical protein
MRRDIKKCKRTNNTIKNRRCCINNECNHYLDKCVEIKTDKYNLYLSLNKDKLWEREIINNKIIFHRDYFLNGNHTRSDSGYYIKDGVKIYSTIKYEGTEIKINGLDEDVFIVIDKCVNKLIHNNGRGQGHKRRIVEKKLLKRENRSIRHGKNRIRLD